MDTFKGKRLSSGKMLLHPDFKDNKVYAKISKMEAPFLEILFFEKDLFDKDKSIIKISSESECFKELECILKGLEIKNINNSSWKIELTIDGFNLFDNIEIRDELEQILIQNIGIVEFPKISKI